jgi:SAM-dependent methyltransferase
MLTKKRILDVYGAQLGELAWHSLSLDNRMSAVSQQNAETIHRAVTQYRLLPDGRPIRILEIGAYAHYGAHKAAADLGGISVAHDVSPTTLRQGLASARAVGIAPNATLVAGDFHNLPFETDYFDLVFCSSSVHHTYRPQKVLQEMMRVLRPGGALHLDNEPVGRALCFYAFRSDRSDQATPFQAEADRRGLMFTLSSPHPGSRPETQFGMTENDRMPLDIIIDTLSPHGFFPTLQIPPQIGSFERRVLDLPRDDDLEAALAELLRNEIEALRPSLSEQDRLLNFNLPTEDDIWRLSYLVAPMLRGLAHLSGQEAEFETARIFGAAIHMAVVKHGQGTGASDMLRRRLVEQNGVLNDLPVLPGVDLDFTARPIPAIEDGDLSALAEVYPPDDWEPSRETAGLLFMFNLRQSCRISLPASCSGLMLLFRFYAAGSEKPFRVALLSEDGSALASTVVVRTESFLFREYLPAHCSRIIVETRTLNGAPAHLPRHVQLSTVRLIPVFER